MIYQLKRKLRSSWILTSACTFITSWSSWMKTKEKLPIYLSHIFIL